MLNGRTMLLTFLIAIFISSTGLSQIEPSQSEILNAVHKVDKEVAVLSEKIEGTESRLEQRIDNKIEGTEGRLDAKIDGINSRITLLMWVMGGVGAVFLAIFLKLIWPSLTKEKMEKENVDTGDPILHELLKELLVKLDVPPPQEVPSRRSSTTSPGRSDSIGDLLKSEILAKMRKV